MAERIEGEADAGTDLIATVRRLLAEAEAIAKEARSERDRVNAVRAIQAAARAAETLGKLQGTIDTSTTINLVAAPIFIELQTAVLGALAGFPEARRAVVSALSGIGDAPLLLEHQP